ncbi:MAG: hypothetical protein WDA16_06335 [Candidatus Thermoplasmatota archaeon]
MATPPKRSQRLVLREKLHIVDYAILLLAFLSLLVFVLYRTDKLTGQDVTALKTIDLTLVALYGSAFVFKWIIADRRLRWLRRNAINALGVFPLTFPFLVPERFFIVVQVIIIVLRTGEALDRAFGARVLRGLFDRYQYMLVEELTDPLLMRLAIVLEDAVTSRDYAAAIGKKLDERRDLVEAAVNRAIEASPKLKRLNEFGMVNRWVEEAREEVVDAATAALTGPELNLIIREGLQDAFTELKKGIKEKKWREKGVGVADVTRGVLRS